MADRPYPVIVDRQSDSQRCLIMLKTLRVSDLQEILRSFGQPKSGKKQDLIGRCERMMNQVNPSTLIGKIEDLQSRRHRDRCAWREPYSTGNSRSPILRSPSSFTSTGIHPFKESPFHEHVTLLHNLVPLGSKRAGVQCETCVRFMLTPTDEEKLASSEYEIHLRFCPYDSYKEKKVNDEYPRQLYVRVNEVPVSIADYHPSMSNKAGYRFHSLPINISKDVHTDSTMPIEQSVCVYWSAINPHKHSHYMLVHMVRKVGTKDLLDRLKEKEVMPPQRARDFVRKVMSVSDGDIATTSIRVSLVCPLSKVRMEMPVRGATCNHMQCFDGQVYLQMNERRATWTCVVCNESASYDSLIIDGLLLEILQTTNCCEIEFESSGNWTPVNRGKCTDEDMQGLAATTRNESTSSSQDDTVIDLTASDDEDTPTAPPTAPTPNNSNQLMGDLDFLDEFLTEHQSVADYPYSPPSVARIHSPSSLNLNQTSSFASSSPDSCNFTTQSSIQSCGVLSSQDEPGPVLTPGSITSGVDVNSSTESTPTGFPRNWPSGLSSHFNSPFAPPSELISISNEVGQDSERDFGSSMLCGGIDSISNRQSPIPGFSSIPNSQNPISNIFSTNPMSSGFGPFPGGQGPILSGFGSISNSQSSIPSGIQPVSIGNGFDPVSGLFPQGISLQHPTSHPHSFFPSVNLSTSGPVFHNSPVMLLPSTSPYHSFQSEHPSGVYDS